MQNLKSLTELPCRVGAKQALLGRNTCQWDMGQAAPTVVLMLGGRVVVGTNLPSLPRSPGPGRQGKSTTVNGHAHRFRFVHLSQTESAFHLSLFPVVLPLHWMLPGNSMHS